MKRLPKFSGLFCTVMLALAALAFMIATSKKAQAQNVCNPSYNATFSTPAPYFVGDTVRINVDVAANTISGGGGTTMTVNSVLFKPSCFNDGGYDTCTQESSQPISFQGNVTTTPGASNSTESNCPSVVWTPDQSVGSKNQPITFTATPALTLRQDDVCTLSFDMKIENLGDDSTPNEINQAGKFSGSCDNGQSNDAGATDSIDVETCSVTIDKQVSCDGGTTWVDVGPDTNPPSGPECTGINAYTDESGTTPATDIKVQYVVTNTGTVGLENCSSNTTETNGLLLGSTSGTVIIPGVNDTFAVSGDQTVGPFTKACSTELASHEADTAMVMCHCVGADSEHNATASDSADFACLSPGLGVVKNCEPQSGGLNHVTVTASNTSSDTPLTNCTATDTYDTSASCETTTATPPFSNSATLSNTSGSPIDLGLSGSSTDTTTWTGDVSGLTADACNYASVTCNVGDTSEEITATSTDTCEVAMGCDTRTAGFWGTHPDIAGNAIGSGLESCGLTITQTDADQACSSTQDICSVGKDSNTLGIAPQDMQLVRQCMAAELNFAITALDQGSCSNMLPGVEFTLDDCCGSTGVCATGGNTVNGATVASCISALDAFNSLETTVDGSQYLTSPGPADSSQCRIANGDGVVNEAGTGCSGDRTYAPKSTGGGPGPASTTNNGQGKALGHDK